MFSLSVIPLNAIWQAIPWTKSGLVTVLLIVALILSQLARRKKLQSLPGPPGIPLLGNILDLSTLSKFPWLRLTVWSRRYGPLFRLSFFGRSVIVLNTAQAAFNFFDQQGSNYTDRPRLIMAGEILAGNIHVGFIPYGPLWKKLRKAAHAGLNSRVATNYVATQERHAAQLVRQLLRDPAEWDKHVHRCTAETILSVIYGTAGSRYQVDTLIAEVDDFMHHMLEAAMPGRYLVDMFPILNSLPAWLVGFKRQGQITHQRFNRLFTELYADAKSSPKRATFVATLTQSERELGISDREAAWLAGSMLGAGFDTTAAGLTVFVLAMVLNPDKMKKAQAEIATVVGPDRLPNFKDYEALPYIVALVKETLRWKPIVPLGLARCATQSGVYNGYPIPAESIVLPNIWAMNHDVNVYENATEFIPERFLTPRGGTLNPAHTRNGTHAFGFGRRICPGMNIAVNTLFINISMLLWAFDFTQLSDASPPTTENFVDTGVVVRPLPFKCAITPRSDRCSAFVGELFATTKSDRVRR